MNRIELTFPKTITRLADNPYGRQIFRDQVASRIDYNEENEIVFPKQIVRASSSFVQGFFADPIKKMGYDRVNDIIKIVSDNESLVNSIYNNII